MQDEFRTILSPRPAPAGPYLRQWLEGLPARRCRCRREMLPVAAEHRRNVFGLPSIGLITYQCTFCGTRMTCVRTVRLAEYGLATVVFGAAVGGSIMDVGNALVAAVREASLAALMSDHLWLSLPLLLFGGGGLWCFGRPLVLGLRNRWRFPELEGRSPLAEAPTEEQAEAEAADEVERDRAFDRQMEAANEKLKQGLAVIPVVGAFLITAEYWKSGANASGSSLLSPSAVTWCFAVAVGFAGFVLSATWLQRAIAVPGGVVAGYLFGMFEVWYVHQRAGSRGSAYELFLAPLLLVCASLAVGFVVVRLGRRFWRRRRSGRPTTGITHGHRG